ncbi:MAG: alpha/beta hydrolase [Agarilytica sp.]
MTKPYEDHYYKSEDGLTLYARDYQHPSPKLTVLCLHGFARNARDFDVLAAALQKDYRVIVADQRGRGFSEYDTNTENYNPLHYTNDMFKLLDTLSIDKVVVIGTSMGGWIAMAMATMRSELVKGIVLNDLGPTLEASGLQEIVEYFATVREINTWDDATTYCKSVAGDTFPTFTEEDWQRFVRKGFEENEHGKVVRLYDLGIADVYKDFDAHKTPLDLWPVFNGAKSSKLMVIRGALSRLLSKEVFEDVKNFDNVISRFEVPDVGHAPLLEDEPTINAIRDFLQKIESE